MLINPRASAFETGLFSLFLQLHLALISVMILNTMLQPLFLVNSCQKLKEEIASDCFCQNVIVYYSMNVSIELSATAAYFGVFGL